MDAGRERGRHGMTAARPAPAHAPDGTIAPSGQARVLVVDDEPSMRELLGLVLAREGHAVEAAADGAQALARMAEAEPDLVIQDLRMPGMPGLELLRRLKDRYPEIPIVVITAFSTWDTTVEAMRLGAYDYLKKPFDTDVIRNVVERALAHRRALARTRLRTEQQPGMLDLVGDAPAIREALEWVRRVAPTESTVLIQGESGTGKELVARMCHWYSARAEAPFITVNCGAFPEALLESELFGHARGAFTGAVADKKGLLEVADGGTFFLDEIGELPLATQVKLLRVLEERRFYPVGGTQPVRVDVRFVCATNRDLAEEVRQGRFRGDLFYRLNVIPITLPPLRERAEDIPLLAGYFVRKHAARAGRTIESIAPAVLDRLVRYPWPGNVRELENAIQRAIVLGRGPVLDQVVLPEVPAAAPAPPAAASPHRMPAAPPPSAAGTMPELPEQGLDLEATLRGIERHYLEAALSRTGGNLTRAAELLGISFRSIRYKVRKLGLRG
ncbi:MAG: acetoacetate metabolism regulatory protein AtoC [Planctomycetota bacterium]|nr:MAG: acetoacetate metabolism regulatory protein AtoC [Planctomycetota bacterium]